MTVKSVIEIDVLDEKFKAFSAAFDKYKKSVDDQSKKWQEINKTLAEAEKRQKAFNKSIEDGGKALRSAAGFTANIASNMASAAVSAAKWLTYSAIGGGFGLGGLAAGASNLRREATGLGLTSSQLRAARTYGEPYLPGIEGVLSGIQTLQTTLTEQYKVGILGGNLNQNAFQNLPDVLTRAREAIKAAGGNIDVAKAITPGLGDVLNQEQLQTVGNMTPEEFARLIQSLRTGAGRLQLDDADYENWRKFFIQLREAGSIIEKSLLKNLEKLIEPLGKLSEAIVKVIDDFLGSDKVQKALQDFANYLGSPEFKQDVQTFFDALKKLGQAIYATAEFLGLIDKSQTEKDQIKKNTSDLSVLQGDIQKDITAPISNRFKNLQLFRNAPDISKVDPKLIEAVKASGLPIISGYRSKEYAQMMGIYHEGSHHTVLNKEGFATAVDVDSEALKQLRSRFKSEAEFNKATGLYAPYGSDPKEKNHLELFNPNKTEIYVVTGDGVSTKAATMAGQQR
jgi:hypothetical protein